MRIFATISMFLVLVGCIEPVQLEWKFDLGAPSLSTPLVTDAFIAVGTSQGVRILTRQGSQRCSFDKAGEVISRPATDGERIFFGSTNYLIYAMDNHCKELWSFQTRDRVKADPIVENGVVYVGSYDGHFYALDAKTGKAVWTFPENQANTKKPSEFEIVNEDPKSAATKAPNEAAAPQVQNQGPTDVGGFSYSSAAIQDGVIFVGNLDYRLYALDAATGQMLWRYKTEAPITSSPTVANSTVYFGSNDGNVYAINIENPKQPTVRWKVPTRDWVNSSVCLDEGSAYVGSNDRRLYALDAKSGGARWSFATRGPAISVPAVFKNLVFIAGGAGDGTVYALNKKTGDLHWRFRTGDKIESDPIVSVEDRHLYVSSSDGYFYAFLINSTVQRR
ncbi:MAG: PQQ-like beta-propeller repeat protein [Deltaproteobacteria bacterium]|jgi:eukaryotic-like serine/threonine-protein kinase|nr:PQQ-like beta-propeller repeat protein [Deltaproteobacteria bacterium]MBT6490932.1 PQQ-like beta-propeller repeat protein [Deltaproteobacteria bacterium]